MLAFERSPTQELPYQLKDREGLAGTRCHEQQDAIISRFNCFYFRNYSPTFQMELTEQYPSKALLLIAEQNTECIIGSAFCLIIHNNDVRFAVNLDALSRSGVKVNPDVLMLARKKNDG